jgi:hypothetical protein
MKILILIGIFTASTFAGATEYNQDDSRILFDHIFAASVFNPSSVETMAIGVPVANGSELTRVRMALPKSENPVTCNRYIGKDQKIVYGCADDKSEGNPTNSALATPRRFNQDDSRILFDHIFAASVFDPSSVHTMAIGVPVDNDQALTRVRMVISKTGKGVSCDRYVGKDQKAVYGCTEEN